ncbi:MAG: glycosyltransferase [Candidatus Magasanikbacteria bacterium]|nr:glycosyltransferase [Candidatus Magasanikbacteria bacterium]
MDKRIKIIYVTCALEVGGAEKFLLDLLTRLDRSRFEPILATVIGAGKLENDFKALNIPLHIFGRRRVRYWSGVAQFCQLFRLFKKEKPTIVHTQLFAADFWGRLAAKAAGVPIIVTTEQNINADQSWLREFLKKSTYRFCDGAVAISNAVKKYMMKKYGVPEGKIEIIPNDVDVAALEKKLEKAPPRNPDKKIILTVGRLTPQKGQDYLLKALAMLPRCELWLAGEGPLEKKLRGLAKNLKIEERVKFLGVRSDIPELLSQADLFVFPSLWEGLGIAVLEAAVAKVPIVASKIDGILDIIKDRESGLLVEPKDAAGLAKATEEILANPQKSRERAEKACDWVKQNFDIKIVTRQYERVYEKLILKKKYANSSNQ